VGLRRVMSESFAWNAFAFGRHFAAAHDGRKAEDARVPHVIRYAVGDNRVDLMRDDGATSSLWWATKNEWLGLTQLAGLQVEALHGAVSPGRGSPTTALSTSSWPGISAAERLTARHRDSGP